MSKLLNSKLFQIERFQFKIGQFSEFNVFNQIWFNLKRFQFWVSIIRLLVWTFSFQSFLVLRLSIRNCPILYNLILKPNNLIIYNILHIFNITSKFLNFKPFQLKIIHFWSLQASNLQNIYSFQVVPFLTMKIWNGLIIFILYNLK